MEGYIAKLNGTPIYAMSAKLYIEARAEGRINPQYIYAIVDKDNYLIQGNYVMGQAVDRFRKVKKIVDGKEWKELLGVKETIHRNPYETEKAKTHVITERPTPEAFAAEGKVKLDAAAAETKKITAEVIDAGVDALAEKVAEGEAIITAVTKPRVKRNNPASRKKRSSVGGV